MASAAESDEDEVPPPEWLLAKRGLQLLINNQPQEAEDLFARYPDSLPIFAGHSFAVFMDALMTFEEDKLGIALETLQEVERRCATDGGWVKSMKKVFGKPHQEAPQHALAKELETQIILADSQVCLATLTFLQQDLSGYFKGSWVLRKAWKIYEAVYHQILQLYKETNAPDATLLGKSQESVASTTTSANGYTPHITTSHSAILTQHTTADNTSGPSTPNSGKNNCSSSSRNATSSFTNTLKKSLSVNSALSMNSRKNSLLQSLSLAYDNMFPASKPKSTEIDEETVKRLMGAVSFGYGLFQLGVSLLPASLMKVTSILGFKGSRQRGIACLMYARKGEDMRAPLATLSLLWYHTIVRPFYAVDGSNVQAGVKASMLLIQESKEYENSALFLFFKGRVYRLKSDIASALECFQSSVDLSTQREIRIMSLHEVGWCHLIQLDHSSAESTFTYLKSWSRWSRRFYSYLSNICTGACGNPINPLDVPTEYSKGARLDMFLNRRKICYEVPNPSSTFWKLLIYEMLYLWNALPTCSDERIMWIIEDCKLVESEKLEEPLLGISKLILGCCLCITNNEPEACGAFRECLRLRKGVVKHAPDTHVTAFAQYELAAILVKSEKGKEEGKVLLQNIEQYKDFDFDYSLNVRCHAILKQL